MTDKPKIAIVAGEMLSPRFLALFEALKSDFDVCVYALDLFQIMDRHGTSLKIRVFENIQDMPGYMRGLEEELQSTQLIIGIETSRLSTFQAVRAARKYGIPMAVVVNEFKPYFYDRYANIRAIQFDVCNKAERFFATSRLAMDALRLDQVPEESIRLMRPVVDTVRFKVDAKGSKKFRDYVGIAENERVLLFHHELETFNAPSEVLLAMQLLHRQNVSHSGPVRLIFAGTGAQTMDLKYRAFDSGLGKQVMFLHQDPTPFLADLYAATDVMIMPRPRTVDFHEELPLKMLEAMACGAVPLVGAGSVAQDLAGRAGVMFTDDTFTSIAAALASLLTVPARLDRSKDQAVAQIAKDNTLAAVSGDLLAEVRQILAQTPMLQGPRFDLKPIVTEVSVLLQQGKERDALVIIEETLLVTIPSATDRAEVLRLKGEAHYGLGKTEDAMTAYSEGLRLDERNFACLRGLGFIAWQSHSNEEALMFFRKAMAIHDNDPETMLGIGLVYRRLGLTEEALFWLERCVVQHDAPPSAVVALAQACAQMSRPQTGIMALLRVLDAIGDNHTLMMTLGQLYLNEGMTEEGNELLKRALAGEGQPA